MLNMANMLPRVAALAAGLPDGAALLVVGEAPVRAMTGFSSSNAQLLVQNGKPTQLRTDSRYLLAAKSHFENLAVDVADIAAQPLLACLVGKRKLRVNTSDMSGAAALNLQASCKKVGIALEDASKAVANAMRAKTAEEIAAARAGAEVAAAAMQAAQQALRVGVSEAEVAWKFEQSAREQGGTAMAFPVIVAFGENSAHPHHQPGQRELRRGDAVLVDAGVVWDGLCTDQTWSDMFGPQTPSYARDHAEVLAALKASEKMARAGEQCASIAAAANQKLGEQLPHALGHGVGWQVHESPSISTKSADALVKNELITLEPGRYRAGKWGIRLENMYEVRAKSAALVAGSYA